MDAIFEGESPRARWPVLPLRDLVVFPHMITPLFVGRKKSILALELLLATQKNASATARHDTEQNTDPSPLMGVLMLGGLGFWAIRRYRKTRSPSSRCSEPTPTRTICRNGPRGPSTLPGTDSRSGALDFRS